MEEVRAYENFPLRLVCISVLVNVSIYALGAYILSGYDPLIAALYLLYCIGNEIHVMKMSCVDCYYYGKWCALGRGKVAPFLFKRRDPVTAKYFLEKLPPDMLVWYSACRRCCAHIKGFSWSMALILTFLPALSWRQLLVEPIACKYCQQRELSCPAQF
jgi:hypothetical protein